MPPSQISYRSRSCWPDRHLRRATRIFPLIAGSVGAAPFRGRNLMGNQSAASEARCLPIPFLARLISPITLSLATDPGSGVFVNAHTTSIMDPGYSPIARLRGSQAPAIRLPLITLNPHPACGAHRFSFLSPVVWLAAGCCLPDEPGSGYPSVPALGRTEICIAFF